MDLPALKKKISTIFEEYFIEWIKTNKESNILDYIDHNKKIKNELDKELNKYYNKTVLKEINKKIQEENLYKDRNKDKSKIKQN